MSQAEGATGWPRRFWPELLAVAGWLAGLAFLFTTRVSQDIAWQLWIGRQMNAGIDLYGRIAEVNPPLWYWMAMPIEALAPRLGLTPVQLLVLAVFALIAVSLGLSATLVRHWPAWQRAALLASMLVALIVLPMQEFEQREHLCLIGALPYALLIARRSRDDAVDWRLALAIGLLAAPFLALKHYFVLIPILLEAWLMWARRAGWRPVRPETLVLASGAIAYGAAVLALESDYLGKMVPLLQLAYGDLRSPLLEILINRNSLIVYLALPYFWLVRKDFGPEAKAILLVAAAFIGAYLIQFKGWQYHSAPVISALLVVIALHLARRPTTPPLKLVTFGAAVALLGLMMVPSAISGRYNSGYDGPGQTMLGDLQPGESAMLLSTKPYIVWPAVEEMRLRWPSRYFHFWMMQTVAQAQANGEALPSTLAGFVDQVRLDTVADLACNPPERIIDDTESVVGADFDLLALFRQEPTFSELFSAYALLGSLGPLDVYQRVRPIPAGLATDCVTIY